jgi:hypothetical protein
VVVVGVCRYFVVVFHRRFSNRRFLSCRIVWLFSVVIFGRTRLWPVWAPQIPEDALLCPPSVYSISPLVFLKESYFLFRYVLTESSPCFPYVMHVVDWVSEWVLQELPWFPNCHVYDCIESPRRFHGYDKTWFGWCQKPWFCLRVAPEYCIIPSYDGENI